MKETVLMPAGMSHSTYEQPLPKSRMTEAAMPYHSNGQATPGGPHVYPEMSAAGLWTTPSDLAHFAIELQSALAGKSTVLSASTAKEMLTPVKGDWGIGIGVGGSEAHPYFQHNGANDGFQCNMVAYNSGDGVAIMTNSDNGGPLAAEILRTIASSESGLISRRASFPTRRISAFRPTPCIAMSAFTEWDLAST